MIDWHRRFQQFAARKEAEAVAADIAPFTTEVDGAGADLVAIGNDWSRKLFDGPWYLSRAASDDVPATSLVFVQSRDGNTGAKNPSALGGGEADKHLVYEGLSRVAAATSCSRPGILSLSRCGSRSGCRAIRRRSSPRCAA